MRKFIWGILFSLALSGSPALAVTCSNPSGFVKIQPPFVSGDVMVLGTDCQTAVDGGTFPVVPGAPITPVIWNGYITGLQPLKLSGTVIGLNPGSWANNTGTALFSSNGTVLTVDLSTATVNFGITPAQGGQVSGALTATGTGTDGTEVFLYLIHRNSDSKVAVIGSSADTQSASSTFTATAATPGVITTAVNHGLRKRMSVYVSNSGGVLPSPLAAGVQYYACTVPALNQITLATSIANANASSCLTFNTTGSGTNTLSWGVQKDIDFQLGTNIATFDRRFPYFAFVWSWSKWGSAGTPGGSNGIPDFQVAQGASDVILTGVGNGATSFQALAGGTSGSFATVDLSPWLANINRRVLVNTACRFAASIGSCFMRAPGSGSVGLQVGQPTSAGVDGGGMFMFQTDSTTKVEYFVTGGAALSFSIMGWTFVDPS